MKLWFVTQRGEMVDLNTISKITIERENMVIGHQSDKNAMVFGNFSNALECKNYILSIENFIEINSKGKNESK